MTLRDERTWSLYCTYVQTSLDKSEQVWSTIFPQPWVPRSLNLAHPQTCVQFPNCTSHETLRPSEVVESALHHTSVGVRCERVWSATFLHRTTMSERSLESSRLGEFKCEISPWEDLRQKKLWLSIVPAQRPSEHTCLGPHQKGVNCNFSWPEFDKPYGARKLSISDA